MEKYTNPDINVSQFIDKGWIHARFIINIAGAPKEHVDKALELVIESMKKYNEMKLVSSDPEEAREGDDKMFTAFSECEIVTKNASLLLSFMLEYMPSSIEILEPERPIGNLDKVNGFLNDILGKLHENDLNVKNTAAKIELINRNATVLLNNFVRYVLKSGPKKSDELAAIIGLPKDTLPALLDKRIKEGKIRLESDTYSLTNGQKTN